ncbi:hypothetical protein EVV80_28675, partial [Klebsiella pneumoniae]
ARQWLSAWCARRGWQLQVADGGAVWNLLAWHQGRLMLGWWSDAPDSGSARGAPGAAGSYRWLTAARCGTCWPGIR